MIQFKLSEFGMIQVDYKIGENNIDVTSINYCSKTLSQMIMQHN